MAIKRAVVLNVYKPDKFILRAYSNGKPEHLEQTIGGTPHKVVKGWDKTYIPRIRCL